MKIKIKNAKPSDAEELQDVLYKTWLATYPNVENGITVDDIEYQFRDRHSPEKLAKLCQEIQTTDDPCRKLLVAYREGHIIGVIRGISGKDGNDLTALYVLPAFQRKGVGRALWNELLKYFDLSKDIHTRVAVYNKKAIIFYRKLGFVGTGLSYNEERFRMKSGSIITEIGLTLRAAQ